MNYTLEGVAATYPGINIGVIAGKGLDNSGSRPGIEGYKAEALRAARVKVGDGPVTGHPYIASWREVYKTFRGKPADYNPSAEALVRRALKEGRLPTINPAVDAYNAVSVRYLIPAGGFDVDRVEGDIRLRFSPGGEAFLPLGTGEKAEATFQGEAVYADDRRILTRRWNYRDCVETRITAETRNVVMFIDGSPQIPRAEVEKAVDELSTRLKTFCGGTYTTGIADPENPAFEIK